MVLVVLSFECFVVSLFLCGLTMVFLMVRSMMFPVCDVFGVACSGFCVLMLL